jgi:hypothetical protein
MRTLGSIVRRGLRYGLSQGDANRLVCVSHGVVNTREHHNFAFPDLLSQCWDLAFLAYLDLQVVLPWLRGSDLQDGHMVSFYRARNVNGTTYSLYIICKSTSSSMLKQWLFKPGSLSLLIDLMKSTVSLCASTSVLYGCVCCINLETPNSP